MTEPQELHDRATRGVVLSDEEMAQLNAWYVQEDEAEARLLGVSDGAEKTDVLQTQIKAALTQVAAVTRQIQRLMLQNKELRREVAVLKQRLAQRLRSPVL